MFFILRRLIAYRLKPKSIKAVKKKSSNDHSTFYADDDAGTNYIEGLLKDYRFFQVTHKGHT